MQLSKHFVLSEFTASPTAAARGIKNEPSGAHLANLRRVALGLEWARSILGDRPIRLTSGYRSPALNTAVGGSKTSDHANGLAADITVPGLTALEVAKTLADSPMQFDQLIYESDRNVVHLGFGDRMRRQVTTQRKVGGALLPGVQP